MMSGKPVYLCRLLLVLLVAATTGCVSIGSRRHADPYSISHHTWWNHYLRGRLYLQDGNYAAARNDFEIALGRKPGARYPYAQDRWRVRTYGMHMLESYFPHRELGICLYYLDESEAALDLLGTSMEMEPSARAKFYLNRIHEQLALDAAPPPGIRLTPHPLWTTERTASLQGEIQGSNRIARVSIDGEAEFIELAQHRIEFNKEVQLQEGENEIPIVAMDVGGKQTSTNVIVMVDWTAPEIYLLRKEGALLLECRDNLFLNRVSMNGRQVPLPMGRIPQRSWSMPIDQPLQLVATDLAGNTATWSLSEKELFHLAEDLPPAPPRIDLINSGATVTLYNPEYELDVRADDDTALKSLKLNGTGLLEQPTPLFRTLRRMPLALGTNLFSVVAEDFDGNREEKNITVIHREPAYLDSIYRMAARLSPVTGEIPDPTYARHIDHLIERGFTAAPVRFYLLAAGSAMEQLRNEQALSSSEWAEARAKLAKAEELEPDLRFIPKVVNDAPGQTVYAKVLDAHSGKELFIEDIYVEDPDLVPRQVDGLVMKIEQRFPLVKSRIRERDGGLVLEDGRNLGTQTGMRMLVIRSDGPFARGRVLEHENHPVEVVVSEVEPEFSQIIVPRGQPSDIVRPGDYVFSR